MIKLNVSSIQSPQIFIPIIEQRFGKMSLLFPALLQSLLSCSDAPALEHSTLDGERRKQVPTLEHGKPEMDQKRVSRR